MLVGECEVMYARGRVLARWSYKTSVGWLVLVLRDRVVHVGVISKTAWPWRELALSPTAF